MLQLCHETVKYKITLGINHVDLDWILLHGSFTFQLVVKMDAWLSWKSMYIMMLMLELWSFCRLACLSVFFFLFFGNVRFTGCIFIKFFEKFENIYGFLPLFSKRSENVCIFSVISKNQVEGLNFLQIFHNNAEKTLHFYRVFPNIL